MSPSSKKTARLVRRPRKRWALPVLFFTGSRAETVTACPDSGSDDNIISVELADRLALQIQSLGPSASAAFALANGTKVSAVGQVTAKCAFKIEHPKDLNEPDPDLDPSFPMIECVFYVFQTLAVPMIMGIEFLRSTKTLTEHRYRLVERPISSRQALRVSSIGRSKRNIVCQIDEHVACATADTGSDLDLVSPEFAASREFEVEDAYEQLEFAYGEHDRHDQCHCLGRTAVYLAWS